MKILLLTSHRKGVKKVLKYLAITHQLEAVCFSDSEPHHKIKQFCDNYDIPILSIEEFETRDFSDIDIAISYTFTRKIKRNVLDSVPLCINFHGGILPQYKGHFVLYYGLMNDEKQWGVSVHIVDDNIDAGDIIHIEKFSLEPFCRNAKAISEYIWKEIGFSALKKVLKMISQGTLCLCKQENTGQYYSKKMLQNEKHITLQDIQKMNVNTLEKKIQSLFYPPYDGAYLQIQDKRFYLLDEQNWQEIKHCLFLSGGG
ncbi:hypothetical protein CCZ01_07430 [Helicobacter monodelphidis]|uniref:formyltransferase family protein n=1 Tax=Helicobacter sp. 15-1451 TaxID=2004995 RepID=UPI000DCBBCA7|nr:formyltransferase family protein [Helicobacter sp. 15-1451]RAX57066.1 hypothetical protein CCZ01_07430 [Helicobacter sp. 15-1451]